MAVYALPIETHLRALDPSRDLDAVANLIEVCFSHTMDADGRDYLRHLRRVADEAQLLRLLPGAHEFFSAPFSGFVWEEDGRVVGNLSLLPCLRKQGTIYLIANVAVHPDYRRRGIACRLTERALSFAREQGAVAAWLQVRDDNLGAYQLYTSLGFIERARRTTWVHPGVSRLLFSHQKASLPPQVQVMRRQNMDWPVHQAWLKRNFPAEVRWNLPIQLRAFSPRLWWEIRNWFQGNPYTHWVARRGQTVLGFATVEPSQTHADWLWLAAGNEEEVALRALFAQLKSSGFPLDRQLSANYPAGRAATVFLEAGFSIQQTLAWMEVRFKEYTI